MKEKPSTHKGGVRTAGAKTETERFRKSGLVAELASRAHEDWRATRKVEGSDTYAPRIKKVRNRAWIANYNGQSYVDIANTPYKELPREWQAENKASAKIAVEEVLRALAVGMPLDERFVERVAEALHKGWVKRNGGWVPEELKKPYAELPEIEKEKDRFFVRRAIEICRRAS